jgi:hypothetical protein
MLIRLPIAVAAAFMALSVPSLFADSLNATLDQQSDVAVTIYNTDLALVKDQRTLTLPKGEQSIAFMGVSGRIRPETAFLRNTQDQGAISIIEQNFDFDLLTPQSLLDKSLGKAIQIVRTNPATGQETIKSAKVLSTAGGLVVDINGQVETNPEGRFIFSELPPNLRAQPTLTTLVDNKPSGNNRYELSYLTGGLSWSADYVVELTGDNRFDLASWVTLSNYSDTEYKNASVQLVAGDVNQVSSKPRVERFLAKTMDAAVPSAVPAVEDFSEYKLYSLPRKTTLANNQTKQVALLSAANVSSHQTLVFAGNSINRYGADNGAKEKLNPALKLNFTNDKKSNLGLALPKGVVRVYQRDSQGNAQFVGEDNIGHTAENENVELTLGKSFDVSATREKTYYKILNKDNANFKYEVGYRVTFKNAKKTPAKVSYFENFDGEWTLLSSTLKSHKQSSSQNEWEVMLPAKSDIVLDFTVEVKTY